MSKDLNPVMDYEEHNRTYALFINMVKYGTIAVILLLIFMAITLL